MNPANTQSAVSDDFIRIAQGAITNSQSNEGELRTAIGRAYYAVFLTARERLFGSDEVRLTRPLKNRLRKKFKRHQRSDPGSHDLIIFAITDINNPPRTLKPLVLAQQLTQLKVARTHADYNFALNRLRTIQKQTWREYAEESVQLASILLGRARTLPPY